MYFFTKNILNYFKIMELASLAVRNRIIIKKTYHLPVPVTWNA
jgi:hypothetical protein